MENQEKKKILQVTRGKRLNFQKRVEVRSQLDDIFKVLQKSSQLLVLAGLTQKSGAD